MNTNQVQTEIADAAKSNLFYIYNGLRYLIRSCKENCLQLVRKGEHGEADHITLTFDQVSLNCFSVLKSAFGVLAAPNPLFELQKCKKDAFYIIPSLGISADEVRALHASSVFNLEIKEKVSRAGFEENVSLITRSILGEDNETHVSVFVYQPEEQSVDAIAQFFNRKGFWVETEKSEDGNVRFTFYW